MAHDAIHGLFRKVALDEITPHVKSVPDMTPADYVDLIDSRYSNPEIRDTVRRVAFDGSSRHTGFLLPIIRDALGKGASLQGLALVEALWARMCAGTRVDGSEIEPNDPNWDRLSAAAAAAKDDPAAWLDQKWIYGDLAAEPRFAEPFTAALRQVWADGPEAAIRAYLAD